MRHSYSGIAPQRRRMLTLALAAIILLAAVTPLATQAQTASEPIQLTGTPALVSGGPMNQTNPHISGSLVSYTNVSSAHSEIRYHNLETGADAAIPTGGHRDSLSDIDGSIIVFRRVFTDGSTSRRPIMAFDIANPDAGLVEIDPDNDARREFPRIGGSTVAWVEQAGPASSQSDIVSTDLDSSPSTRLTTDGMDYGNRAPAVSPDGTVITWMKCQLTGPACDIYTARKNADGTWGAATQLTNDPAEEFWPATNGQVVAYSSDAMGSFDIWWANIDGSNPQYLAMPGEQYQVSMSGNLMLFESKAPESSHSDIFVYDLVTANLYQVTSTPDVDETLSDLSVDAAGTVRVVWAQPDGLTPGNNDIYSVSFELPKETGYEICPLFDQTRSYKVRSTVPIRLQLCDEQGGNLSSPALAVTATGLVKQDSTSSPVVVEDSGNANPDNNFRYDESLQGYAYNLSTRNLSAGTWQLHFTVSGDSTLYSVTFDLR